MCNISKKQQEWLTNNNKEYPVLCKMCDNHTKWYASKAYFRICCSKQCATTDEVTIKEKFKATNLQRHGVAYPQQNKAIRQKTIDTMQTKYGVDNPMQHAPIREQTKNTNLLRYGVLHPAQNTAIQMKTKGHKPR